MILYSSFSNYSILCKEFMTDSKEQHPLDLFAGDSHGVPGRPLVSGRRAWRSSAGAQKQEAQHPLSAHRRAAPSPLHKVHQSPRTQEQGQKRLSTSRVKVDFSHS